MLVEVDGWGFNPGFARVVFVVGWDGYGSEVCLSCAACVLSVYCFVDGGSIRSVRSNVVVCFKVCGVDWVEAVGGVGYSCVYVYGAGLV